MLFMNEQILFSFSFIIAHFRAGNELQCFLSAHLHNVCSLAPVLQKCTTVHVLKSFYISSFVLEAIVEMDFTLDLGWVLRALHIA